MSEEKSTSLALSCPNKVLNEDPRLKLNDEVTETVCSMIRSGAYRETACAAVGIHSRTLRRWLKRALTGEQPYADFANAMLTAEAEAERRANAVITAAAGTANTPGDWRASAWWLERRFPNKYGPQVRVAVQNELEKFFAILKDVLPREEYDNVLAAIAATDCGAEGAVEVEYDVEAGQE